MILDLHSDDLSKSGQKKKNSIYTVTVMEDTQYTCNFTSQIFTRNNV